MSSPPTAPPKSKSSTRVDRVVIRFSGDSGDGMQITGSQFTNTAASFGNDLSTFPDYPAEIRAPAGTLPGVSGFQIHFASTDIFTPGDAPDVLVAMNPAALKVNLPDLRPGGLLIVNTDAFTERDLHKAGYTRSPIEDGSLDKYRLIKVELQRLTRAALQGHPISPKAVDRCKNFFALGMMYYLYHRSPDTTIRWLQEKFTDKPEIRDANIIALKGGIAYCEATELFHDTYEVPPAQLSPGKYRNVNGNQALALGFLAAAHRAGRPLFLGTYPITPASDILHELSYFKNFGVMTFQAEDEIAAVTAAIGASYAGSIGLTTSSGPGIALKTEAIGLAVMTELPLVIVDVQRGGPSTGLPTKTEQADLFQAIFGRNSEAPLPVLAPATPSDCFWIAFEAVRLATKYMTPVMVLSDGYIANGSEPWRVPAAEDLPSIPIHFWTDPGSFKPYLRDPETLARPWAIPGTPGLEHRIGGLEKQEVTGAVSYDSRNHERMIHLRADKIARVVQDVPNVQVHGDREGGELLVVGWGSTYGSILAAVNRLRSQGKSVSSVHLRHLNPMPRNLGEVLHRFRRVLVPELNLGQLAFILRGRYLINAHSYTKVQGQPFKEGELVERIQSMLEVY